MSKPCKCKFRKLSNPQINAIVADLESIVSNGPKAK